MVDLKLEDLCVGENISVREAMSGLNETASGVLLVVDENGHLIGTLSDGDIRRWILEGGALTERATKVANHNPITATTDVSTTAARALMDQFDIHLIPVIDHENKVIDFWTRSHRAVRDETPVVIMAGGLGTRLRPLTEDVPKPMLRVGNVPVLERILLRYIGQGAHKFYIAVNYLAEVIEEYFGDGSRWDVSISYIRESKRLGTGGALSLLEENDLTADCVVVVNGDVISEINIPSLISHHRNANAAATVCVRPYKYTVPFGVIHHNDGFIKDIEEKPTVEYSINAGIYCVSNDAIRTIPKNEFYDMPQLFKEHISLDKPCSFMNLTGYWIDIGSHDEYHRANAHFSM